MRKTQTLPSGNPSRMMDYRAPTPATLSGAQVLSTAEAAGLWHGGTAVFIDVLPQAPRPANLPEGRCSATSHARTFREAFGSPTRATAHSIRRRRTTCASTLIELPVETKQDARLLLPQGLLDVVERGEARLEPRLSPHCLVSRWHGRMDGGGPSCRADQACSPARKLSD